MQEIKKRIKAIIFDMDGTILRTEHIWVSVVREVLYDRGIVEFTPEQEAALLSITGAGMRTAAKVLCETFSLSHSVEELIAEKIARSNAHFERNLEFIEGFEKFHELLREHGFPTGLATNAHQDNLKCISIKMDFNKFFGPHQYCVRDVNERPKPDPALFLHAAAQLGVRPEECLVFEDSMPGFNAAKGAGMKCIAIKSATNKDILELVHDAIDHYGQAEEALRKILHLYEASQEDAKTSENSPSLSNQETVTDKNGIKS